MFRNQYDTDCTTWSPAGRIHQIEYALEAVKQGSAAIGLRSNKYAIVATLKRASSELSSHQKKIFKIDDHVGVAIAGLVADARVLAKYMRTECINHRYTYDEPMQAPFVTLPQLHSPQRRPPFAARPVLPWAARTTPLLSLAHSQVNRLSLKVADKSQIGTIRAGHRPYGIGLLIAGADSSGPHLFETQPSGQYFECAARLSSLPASPPRAPRLLLLLPLPLILLRRRLLLLHLPLLRMCVLLSACATALFHLAFLPGVPSLSSLSPLASPCASTP